MNRRLLALSVICGCVVLAGGCGSSSNGNRIAMVTDSGGTTGSAEVSAIYSGIESYAADHSLTTGIYTAAADTEEELAAQFKAAADDHAGYVVCTGENMESAVYDAQDSQRDQYYLYFNGVPRKGSDEDGTIRSNTECFRYDVEDMAFLAGYAAVGGGYRNIMYMTGDKSDEHIACRDSFMRGIEKALSSLGITSDSLRVSEEYAGSSLVSPLRMKDAINAYDSGTDLIVTDEPGIAKSIEAAAGSRSKYVATIGFDELDNSSAVVFSAVGNGNTAVQYVLNNVLKEKGFEGGTLKICGAKERAIGLSADYSRMASFDESACTGILDAMAEGTAGSAGEDEASALQLSFSVTEVEPVTPDGTAGLEPPPTAPPEGAAASTASA